MKRLVIIALYLVTALSCSIREDRSSCPCLLYVHASGEIPDGKVLLCVSYDGKMMSQGVVERESVLAGQACVTVRRGLATVTMFTGIVNMAAGPDGNLKIPGGCSCDGIRAFSDPVDVDGEEYHYTGTLHKDYADLHIRFVGIQPDLEVSVTGEVDGFRNVDKSPVQGAFSCRAGYSGTTSEYSVRLPRQAGGALSLSVVSESGESRDIRIGTMITDSGYDWSAADLLDIRLTVDLSSSKVEIGVADWNPIEYDIVEV